MSFIQSTIKCKKCGHEDNIATGTFGFGVPEKCAKCGKKTEGYDNPWYEVIGDGWHAKEECQHFIKVKNKLT
jgi:hypothetical protein